MSKYHVSTAIFMISQPKLFLNYYNIEYLIKKIIVHRITSKVKIFVGTKAGKNQPKEISSYVWPFIF